MKNSKVKKKVGNDIYNYLNRNFNDDYLAEHLPTMFGLLADIKYIKKEEYDKLKLLLNKKNEENTEEKKPVKTAKQLLDEAGFILHDDIKTKEDYTKFEKYFKESESLCKFGSYDATSRYGRVFWVTRKGFENIKRSENPSRQDEYSTSIMSVGISKDLHNVAQITSRYNHTVSGCDNTYNSNLDNIVEGLTEAFNNDYNLSLKKGQSIEFDNFYYHENKYWHYHYEINGKKYGDNTIDGVIYNSDTHIIFDNFILDIKNRKIETADGTTDAFVDMVNDKLQRGDSIQIVKEGHPLPEDHKGKIIIVT